MILAVTDTGPLLHLTEADALDLLRLMGDLHVPPQVMAEMAYHLIDWSLPEWITLDILTPAFAADAEAWQQAGLLDAGEAEAIALALLASSSLWISHRVLSEARSALDEIFAPA